MSYWDIDDPPKPTASATSRYVRDLPVRAKLRAGQIIVEQRECGVMFSFPAAVWPVDDWEKLRWVARLTPWWDIGQPDWSPRSHRLRESCVTAIDTVLVALPRETANPPADRSKSAPTLP